jgi:hypothetical protein
MFLAKCFDGIIIHNKEMITVKKLLFVVLIALWVVPAVALISPYTLNPMAVRGDRVGTDGASASPDNHQHGYPSREQRLLVLGSANSNARGRVGPI